MQQHTTDNTGAAHRRWMLAAGIGLCVCALMAASVIRSRHTTLQPGPKPMAPTQEAAAPSPANNQPPNVVFMVLDAFRADRIGAMRNGIPVTPFLSALANESLYFPRAASPCSWTKPAMASILTARYVDAHQVLYSSDSFESGQMVSDALAPAFETLSEWFKAQGYSTATLQTNANLTRELGFDQGVDFFRFGNGYPADWITQNATEFLASEQTPFLLYTHYMEPHAPYTPPKAYQDFFGPVPALSPADQAAVDDSIGYLIDKAYHVLGLRPERRFAEVSPEGRERLLTLYDAECRFMDDEIARLTANIRDRFPNTLFIITADHGEEFWEHGGLGHGATLYNEALTVPLMINGPGIAPLRCDTRVSTTSILPTLAAALNQPQKPEWQGGNLLSVTARVSDTLAFSITYGVTPKPGLHIESVILNEKKLIWSHGKERLEFYNLAADPGETHDLAAQDPQTVEQLKTLLDEHRTENLRRHHQQGLPASVATPSYLQDQLRAIGYLGDTATPPPAQGVPVNEEAQERLKSVGYLQ